MAMAMIGEVAMEDMTMAMAMVVMETEAMVMEIEAMVMVVEAMVATGDYKVNEKHIENTYS